MRGRTFVGLDHVVLRCADVEASLRWYVDVLGLTAERVDEWRAGSLPFPSVRISPDSIVDLIPAKGPVTEPNVDHVCLVADRATVESIAADRVSFRLVGEPGPRRAPAAMGGRSTCATPTTTSSRSATTRPEIDMTGPGGLQTVNVMVTDVVGSTGTLVRAGADAADAERRRHDTIVRNVVEVFGGSVVKSTGDGALAVLPSADHLVRAGSAVQEAARAAGFPIRVGMSTGDAMSERGDLFGEPVVVASRLCDVCPVGDVLVDAATIVVRGNRHEPAVGAAGALDAARLRRAA